MASPTPKCTVGAVSVVGAWRVTTFFPPDPLPMSYDELVFC